MRGYTLNDVLDKAWSQVSCLLPPGTCLRFCCAQGSAFPLFNFSCSSIISSQFSLTHVLALFTSHFLREKKSLRARVCIRCDLNPRPSPQWERYSPINTNINNTFDATPSRAPSVLTILEDFCSGHPSKSELPQQRRLPYFGLQEDLRQSQRATVDVSALALEWPV